MSTDQFCLIDGDDVLDAQEFCMLTNEPVVSNYNMTAVVGFGKPDGSYSQIMNSPVGQWWSQYELKPQVTYDMQFNGTMTLFYIGAWSGNPDEELYFTANSSASSDKWALDVSSVVYGNTTYDSLTTPVALLESNYPYISVPSDMWTSVNAELVDAGFVCFAQPYEQLTHCQAPSSCNSLAGGLTNFTINFLSTDGTETYAVDIFSTFYLL